MPSQIVSADFNAKKEKIETDLRGDVKKYSNYKRIYSFFFFFAPFARFK